MKKLLIGTLLTLSSSLFTLCMGQYSILHSFNGTAGAYPEGLLTLTGSKFYGMANEGGANGYGCIFSMDTTGANYKDIWDFNDTGSNGAYPIGGSLKIVGYKLYGMTNMGGRNDSGVIFSIDTNGGGYKDIHDFSGPDGSRPQCSLTLSGNQLFGMTFEGGASLDGNIFELDTNGSGYKDLMDFNGTNGWNPYGDVTLIGDKLWGMTSGGGVNNEGNIFSIDTNGSNFTDLLDFAGATFPSGQYPNNLLVQGGSQFFGMTYSGGGAGDGNVFSIDTNGTFFKDLVDFNGTSSPYGLDPYADVILKGNVLFGLAEEGGMNDSGCIFAVDTNGSNYIDLFDFSGPNGNAPLSDVTIIGNVLYGTTVIGGTDEAGVIFKFNLAATGINPINNNASVKLYPNPNNGQFTIHTSPGSGASLIEIYNTLGEMIYSSNLLEGQTDNTINISSQPAGVYLYRVLSDKGALVGEYKFVIE